MSTLDQAPRVDPDVVARWVEERFALRGSLHPLPSERDQNFRLQTDAGEAFVVKIANAAEDPAFLEAQNQAMQRASAHLPISPRVRADVDGARLGTLRVADRAHHVRVLSHLPGVAMAKAPSTSQRLAEGLGRSLGALDLALQGWDHPTLHRSFAWNLREGLAVVQRHAGLIDDREVRAQVIEVAARFERETAPHLAHCRQGAIHNDANDHNVIVDAQSTASPAVGIIDFGDMVHSWVVAEVAIAAAYAILDAPEPLDVLQAVVAGYHTTYPLRADELDAVYGLCGLRLAVSASMAAYQQRQRPDDPYLIVSQAPIRRTLPKLLERPMALGRQVVRDAAATGTQPEGQPTAHVAAARQARIGPSLSLGYRRPLHVQRGYMQFLYDVDGRRFLDAYNNVPHVGHCHPRVVAAVAGQAARLNTNTRYLYDALPEFAERLCATLPEPLQVCFVVNSASEANELAVRLMRAATGARDTVVLDAAYHGHTTTLIDLSPYKHAGPGGQGAPPWVHVAALPDAYRGRHRGADVGQRYAADVAQRIEAIGAQGRAVAGFVAETCPSVGGQLILPPGYLAEVYRSVRAAGGLCVADEVQTGFGRLGDCFYAFEAHDVVPDMVVLGKPMGNGHPLAAVVTTKAIAAAFDNGMEFFSTFGGNPVACRAGLAVLDVLADEGLAEHATRVGARLLEGLAELQRRHPIIGDVRGRGLFLGAELVCDPDTRAPDPARAADVSNAVREAGVLIGTDGPDHNVLKIRPPMPFDLADADRLIEVLDAALGSTAAVG